MREFLKRFRAELEGAEPDAAQQERERERIKRRIEVLRARLRVADEEIKVMRVSRR